MDGIGAKIENLTIGEIDEIIASMEAAIATEENTLNCHEINGDKAAAEQCIWNCVVFNAYIDLLRKASASLAIKNTYDLVLKEKDAGLQVVNACKLIIRIAKENAGTAYLVLITPLVKPPKPEKQLSKEEQAFVQRELLATLSINAEAPE